MQIKPKPNIESRQGQVPVISGYIYLGILFTWKHCEVWRLRSSSFHDLRAEYSCQPYFRRTGWTVMKGHEITYQHVTMDMAKAVTSDAVHQHSKMPEMIRSYFRALHQLQLLFAICGVEASAAAGFQRLLTSTYPKRQFMFGLSLGFQGQGGGEGNPIIKITRFRLHTLLHSNMFFQEIWSFCFF